LRFMAVSFVWSAMFNQRCGPAPRAANLVCVGGKASVHQTLPMGGNVQACGCGYAAVVHARGQQDCRYFGDYDWRTDLLGCNSPLDDEAAS